jgi:hypothetical protein
MLLDEGNIQYIFSFSNERFFFPGVHHSFKFALVSAQKGPQSEGFWAAFRFNPRVAVRRMICRRFWPTRTIWSMCGASRWNASARTV